VFEYCFAFIVLPLLSDLPDFLIRSIPHDTGRINRLVLQTRDELIGHLRECGVLPVFIATDGDNGVANFHEQSYNLYKDHETNVSLEVIVNQLTGNGAHPLECWPISDFLHLLKNARTRIATGILTFNAHTTEVISAISLNQTLKLGKDLEAHNPLDLLKDDLALRVFTLGNLIKLWGTLNMLGTYFLMPFVALNLAIRNDLISRETRLGLIQVAFSIFFRMLKEYPTTGDGFGIYEMSRTVGHRKTLWTQVMCIRACNLCVGLYWALRNFANSLPLGRIGTHSVECHFGTTRSQLRGDTRWSQFLGRQVDSVMIQNFLTELGVTPYIRRFKSVSGCTIMEDDPKSIHVSFDDAAQKLEKFANLLKCGAAQLLQWDENSILLSFEQLAEKLSGAQYVEKLHRPSLTRGLCITNRIFAASAKREQQPVTVADAVYRHADDEVPEISS
jgi:hypothetical protein